MEDLKKFELNEEDLEQVNGGVSYGQIVGGLTNGIESTGIKDAIGEIKKEVSGLMDQISSETEKYVVKNKKVESPAFHKNGSVI